MAHTTTPQSTLASGKKQHYRLFEYAIYIIILATALGAPFFVGDFSDFGLKRISSGWLRFLPFVLIFAVNNFLLVPGLLFREKYLQYFLGVMFTVITVIYFSSFLFETVRPLPLPPESRGNIPAERMGEYMPERMRERPPGNMRDRGMPPRRTPFLSDADSLDSESISKNIAPPESRRFPPPFVRPEPPFRFTAGRLVHPLFNYGSFLIAILLIGFNTGVKSFVRWNEEKVAQSEKERQYYYTELALLKHQISPHFLMNTLNNIHALVDIDTGEAKNAIIRLSRLLRYLLYESDVQHVPLEKEINFIKSYIELMRLRFDDDMLTVEAEYPDNTENAIVPSSLFLSFIENAFKHGVHPNIHSIIKLGFSVENSLLTFRIVNNCLDSDNNQIESIGIGLENVRKRLDLIYKDNYTLDIHPSGNLFEVILKIPVS